MAELLTFDALVAFLTLTALEIVLGIDNIVFIAIITGRLDPAVRGRTRQIGLLAAMGMRVVLLLAITWIMGLTRELFSVFGHGFSGKDLILLAGGLFLVAKATYEIHHKLEEPEVTHGPQKLAGSFSTAVFQIVLIDLVFSLDSVITAVGIARQIEIMIAAVIVAVLVMMWCAGPISSFIERHPTLKMLALAFLILIGVMLVADGLHHHIPRGYIYFAMAFSLGVEFLNMRARRMHEKLASAGSRSDS